MRLRSFIAGLCGVTALAAHALAEGPEPPKPAAVPEAVDPTIGYPTVAAALADLRAKRNVTFSMQGGFLVARDPSGSTLWLFLPAGHPAYPSVFRRGFVSSRDGGTSMETNLRCEASKAACDDLAHKYLGADASEH